MSSYKTAPAPVTENIVNIHHPVPDFTSDTPCELVTYPILAARSIVWGDIAEARDLMADFAKEGRDLAPYERHALDRACRHVRDEYGCNVALDGNALA